MNVLLKFSVCAMSISLVCLSGCDSKEGESTPLRTVSIIHPQVADMPLWMERVGTLSRSETVSVLPQVEGFLKSQDYVNGASVKRGDVLFRIDDVPFRNAFEKATAKLAEANAEGLKAEDNKNRYEQLVEKDESGTLQYEDAVLAFQQAQANILAAQAELDLSKINLDYTVVSSPIDGVAGPATVQVGDLVSPSGKILTELCSVNPMLLNFSVPEAEWLNQEGGAHEIQLGSKVDVILHDGEKYSQQAEVVAIDREFNKSTGAVVVHAKLANDDLILIPGMSVQVKILLEQPKNVFIVPRQSISLNEGRFFIVILDASNKQHRIPVEIGTILEGQVVIKVLRPNAVSVEDRKSVV